MIALRDEGFVARLGESRSSFDSFLDIKRFFGVLGLYFSCLEAFLILLKGIPLGFDEFSVEGGKGFGRGSVCSEFLIALSFRSFFFFKDFRSFLIGEGSLISGSIYTS